MIYDLDLKHCRFKRGQEVTPEEVRTEIVRLRRLQTEQNNKNLAYKKLLNSIYGVLGYEKFVLYQRDVAESISTQSQSVLKSTRWFFNQYFQKRFPKLQGMGFTECRPITDDVIIYGDTDSLFINYEDILRHIDYDGDLVDFVLNLHEKDLDGEIRRFLDAYVEKFNGFRDRISGKRCFNLAFEQILGRLLMVAKKRYVKEILYEDGSRFDRFHNIQSKGLELGKSSTPAFVREKLKKVTHEILQMERLSVSDIRRSVLEVKEEFCRVPIEDISQFQRVNKVEKYILECSHNKIRYTKGTANYLKGVAAYNNLLSMSPPNIRQKYPIVTSGSKIQWFNAKPSPKAPDGVFAYIASNVPHELLQQIEPNYNMQFDLMFLSPLNRMLTAMKLPAIPVSMVVFDGLF